MILFAILVGLTLYGLAAPDPVTLRTTRGAAGAIRSMPAPTRSTSPRSTRGAPRPTRSGRPARSSSPPRSGRSSRTRSTPDRPDPIGSPRRSDSRIARAIGGWIDASDRAVKRRGEAVAAVGELRARVQARRAARDHAEAEDQAHAENERRDRAEQRARPIPPPPAAIPPPARPTNGAHVDTTQIPTTEMETLDHLLSEIHAALAVTQQVGDAWLPLQNWLNSVSERYQGANDLPKTPRMDAAESTVSEVGQEHVLLFLHRVEEKLKWFAESVTQEQARLKEIGPSRGRLENVSS